MYFVLYNTITGDLVSQGTVVANPVPVGLTAQDIINPPADNTVWNTTSRSFVVRPSPRIIPKSDFIQRFTIAERKEMFGFSHGTTYTAAQQKNLAALMRYMDFLDRIDLDDAAIQQGVPYLETIGVIAVGRAAQVLA